MFFAISKIAWLFLDPPTLLLFLACCGLVAARLGRARAGRVLLIASVFSLAGMSFFPVGEMLMKQLEDRFPAYVDDGSAAIAAAFFLARAGYQVLNTHASSMSE